MDQIERILKHNVVEVIEEKSLQEKLRSGKYYGSYAACNFYGLVWFEDEKFFCHIKRHYCHVETISADTLEEIMTTASEKYEYA